MYQATPSNHDDPGDATVRGHSGRAPKANTRCLPRRPWQAIFLAALLCGLVYQGLRQYHIAYPNRNHAMPEAMKDTQTFCVGRFLIDLPQGTTVIGANSNITESFSAEYPVPHNIFELKMAERWKTIKAMKADPFDNQYVKPSQWQKPMEDMALFTFKHVILHGPNVKGVMGSWDFHHTEAYLWRDKTLYSFTNDSDDDLIIKTMRSLQVLHHNQIPHEAGFCGPYSFFPGGAAPESVWVAFRLPTNPAIELRLRTTTWSKTAWDGQPVSAPTGPPRPHRAMYESADFKGMTHRDARRIVAGFEGKEWIEGTTQKLSTGNETLINANWFTPGESESSGRPSIHAMLDISYQTAQRPPSWGSFPPKPEAGDIGQEEFMAYWDTVLGTLRLRPGALPPGSR